MSNYLVLINYNCKTRPTESEWKAFWAKAERAGIVRGRGRVAPRSILSNIGRTISRESLAGFMMLEAADLRSVEHLLNTHPVVANNGSIEVFEIDAIASATVPESESTFSQAMIEIAERLKNGGP